MTEILEVVSGALGDCNPDCSILAQLASSPEYEQDLMARFDQVTATSLRLVQLKLASEENEAFQTALTIIIDDAHEYSGRIANTLRSWQTKTAPADPTYVRHKALNGGLPVLTQDRLFPKKD